MWEIDSNNQALTAILAVGLGVCICLVYDVLRSVRDYKRLNNIAVFFIDVFFCIISAITVFSFSQLYSNGEIRFYILLFIGMGFVFCRVTVSYFLVKILKKIMRKVGKIFSCFFGWTSRIIQIFEKITDSSKKIIKKPFKREKRTQKTLEKQ